MPWEKHPTQPCGLKGRESGRARPRKQSSRGPSGRTLLLVVYPGHRPSPQPWAPFSRPVGPVIPVEERQTGLRARHLAFSLARCGGGRFEGMRPPFPASPRSPTASLPGGGGIHGFPGDQVPSLRRTGGVLGHGGRPSYSIVNEPGDSTSLPPNRCRLSAGFRASSASRCRLSAALCRLPADPCRPPGGPPGHPPGLAGTSPTSAGLGAASAGLPLTSAGLRQPFPEDRRPFPGSGQPWPTIGIYWRITGKTIGTAAMLP